jgi:hypothetical protein
MQSISKSISKKENQLIHEEVDISNYRKIMVANCIMEKIKIMSQNVNKELHEKL